MVQWNDPGHGPGGRGAGAEADSRPQEQDRPAGIGRRGQVPPPGSPRRSASHGDGVRQAQGPTVAKMSGKGHRGRRRGGGSRPLMCKLVDRSDSSAGNHGRLSYGGSSHRRSSTPRSKVAGIRRRSGCFASLGRCRDRRPDAVDGARIHRRPDPRSANRTTFYPYSTLWASRPPGREAKASAPQGAHPATGFILPVRFHSPGHRRRWDADLHRRRQPADGLRHTSPTTWSHRLRCQIQGNNGRVQPGTVPR